MSFFSKIFSGEEKSFKEEWKLVNSINNLEKRFESLDSDKIKSESLELKKRLKKGEEIDGLLPEAFALVREASKRSLGQRHYDVQLLGGITLHEGKIAEMRTGEGKTLVATLPAYLNALKEEGVHIVTVNDYLAHRDAVWMGQIYRLLGLTVGCIYHESSFLYDPDYKRATFAERGTLEDLDKERDERGGFHIVHEFLRPCSRKEAYAADITYCTNNELGFDYLRDNIAYEEDNIVQRGYNYAIVDEIDSILIDEARTPLIISAPAAESEGFYKSFSKIAGQMQEKQDYTVDEKLKTISLMEEGIEKAEKILGIGNIYTEKGIKYVHHLETAVRAKALFNKDKQYVVKNNEVIIVDEFTGRMQPGRRWGEGLHQAIEAKEGVAIQRESRTFASVTFQNYFRMYKKLAGMTGTAMTSAEEFDKVYKLETLSIPTNKPMVRKDYPDLIFQTMIGKFQAVAKKIKELNEKGQPVLVGTVSIEKNEYLSAFLKKEGVSHKLLNAKNHEEEGEIIAQAGRKGRVTIATNMAGRGVDIVLGGNPPEKTMQEEVKNLGGLFVIGTERHEARRIDNQLRGRAGRQGDKGGTQFFVSLDDDLMRVFASDKIKNMMGKFGIPEDQPIESKIVTRSIESAQGKIEGFNFDARKHLLEYDDVMNKQRKAVYEKRRKILFGSEDFIWGEIKNLEVSPPPGSEASSMEKKREEMGDVVFFKTIRKVMLQNIDMLWMEHLETMDYMRASVRLRAYGQRDPLIEYKNEGVQLFRELEASIDENLIKLLSNMGVGAFTQEKQKLQEIHQSGAIIRNPPKADAQSGNSVTGSQIGKIGRNDPCHCGSGKKYKKCCGK